MRIFKSFFLSLLILLIFFSSQTFSAWGFTQPEIKRHTSRYDPALYKEMRWRCIGPYRGGRVDTVAGIPGMPHTYYLGAVGGGVWKTKDGGISWENISDGFFETSSVGAIAIAETDPNIVYVGMGEETVRTIVIHGNGMYKSEDAGKTWKHIGLTTTKQISRVRIHPHNPNLVYVAAIGHVFGPNEERGVFRSKDGGKTWEKILYRDNKTGAIDLILDPCNPRIIYAALWEFYRTPYYLGDGGAGSGLFKSSDGGDTWTEISHNNGLPEGILGKIGVTVSPAKPNRVWAIIEAMEGGIFRSEDGGKTWIKLTDDGRLLNRAWYYHRIYADTKDPDTVYVLNTSFFRSSDGGKTYIAISVPHGDNHDLWIDPDNPKRMINANDGGANVSYNGGMSWTRQDNQPTAQFYHVITDNQFPYWIYGAQQDNSTVRIASRTNTGAIDKPHWHAVGGGESGWIAPRHDNSDIVFAGSYGGRITRWDYKTDQARMIIAHPSRPMGKSAAERKYRFKWTSPIICSRFDSNVVYHAAQVLFKTTNEGQSWEIISPDLTTNDKEKQKDTGGPIRIDNIGCEVYCSINTVAESFHDPNILWAGTDDGLVHITKDGGENWDNITPKDLPPWSCVNMIDPSTFESGSAYVAIDRHQLDDFSPYVYKTSDFGKSWTMIINGIPGNTFVRVVREDPQRKGLLYAGAETGAFVSFDDGANWQSLQLNLPVSPIYDLVVKENDLVVATFGRAFWILDDLTPLQQITDEVARSDVFLFKPRDAYRMGSGSRFRGDENVGVNPPGGSVIYYFLKNKSKAEVTLEFLDARGNSIRKFSSKASPQPGIELFGSRVARQQKLTSDIGMNRFIWNMRYPDTNRAPGAIFVGEPYTGPVAVPGTYQVSLTVGDKTTTQTWEWKIDPRLKTTQAEFQEQFDLIIKLQSKNSEVSQAIIKLRDVKKQIDVLFERIKKQKKETSIIEAGNAIQEKLTTVEEELIQRKAVKYLDYTRYPMKLDYSLVALAGYISQSDNGPTDGMREFCEELLSKAEKQLLKLKNMLDSDLAAFNTLLRESNIPAVFVQSNM
ncbi:glycosyl hydrolase [Acidobacteriota bacterium]